jgi:hypothetical protein
MINESDKYLQSKDIAEYYGFQLLEISIGYALKYPKQAYNFREFKTLDALYYYLQGRQDSEK